MKEKSGSNYYVYRWKRSIFFCSCSFPRGHIIYHSHYNSLDERKEKIHNLISMMPKIFRKEVETKDSRAEKHDHTVTSLGKQIRLYLRMRARKKTNLNEYCQSNDRRNQACER